MYAKATTYENIFDTHTPKKILSRQRSTAVQSKKTLFKNSF